ncbi:hypothetical protein DPMN_184450 [Dreissena polymorpha]|uniref:Uncharacterized protein n=1 Tax=Dreissena polymorpha TaxID=45954 RepID=A0A9D4I6E3_DREPO|nr:hypothetical protein DPMN_184450 [Dreissena polymorpha]
MWHQRTLCGTKEDATNTDKAIVHQFRTRERTSTEKTQVYKFRHHRFSERLGTSGRSG